ncbi:UDP-GlcA:arabinogalactan -glucuronosyltransferase, family GT14 [Zostera marina]|uniref:UDP-GlcA:arabinogalactan-glucuronosyltransferase, family GT14 n=1 Tax=Zostera marina TaxID=29655 RepID=A0A0K9PZV2_ZOSMR|nr:UDP-GlcA:arabinogalactan -glucuronosyltransferase, family GT14 [Zostera marina]
MEPVLRHSLLAIPPFRHIDRRWIIPLAAVTFLSFLVFITTTALPTSLILPFLRCSPVFVESELRETLKPTPFDKDRRLPRLAYLVSGSVGDGEMMERALLALYHPLNWYILHLDLEAPLEEREKVTEFVEKNPIFKTVGNVKIVRKPNLVTYRGPTMVASTLHAAAILLREYEDWDWFINLSATDYPLITQDDLLHTFSDLPRELNFVDHTSNIGWKAYQRAKPVIIDPGLYLTRKRDVFWVRQRRSIPTAFKLYTGSAWMVLSRSFIEYCIWGWDNLPRHVFMYYANFISSPEGYFHTVICNAKEFRNTTVNSDLHFITWDNPPKQHPHVLTLKDMPKMIDSNAPFARKFPENDPVLDKLDEELLLRRPGMFVRGGWCAGSGANGTDPCLVMGNQTHLQPGPGAFRLKQLIDVLLSEERFKQRQCN